VHCSTGPQQNVDDDYCACRVKAVGGRGYWYNRCPPPFFSEQGPARSKSGPGHQICKPVPTAQNQHRVNQRNLVYFNQLHGNQSPLLVQTVPTSAQNVGMKKLLSDIHGPC